MPSLLADQTICRKAGSSLRDARALSEEQTTVYAPHGQVNSLFSGLVSLAIWVIIACGQWETSPEWGPSRR